MESITPTVSRQLAFVVACGALTGLMLGFDLSIIAVVLAPINQEFKLCYHTEFTCLKKELLVAMIAPGALIGSLAGGISADYFGRRATLLFSDILFIVGSISFCFVKTFGQILLARCVVGGGVGVGFVVFSTYVSEIAPPKSRGRLVMCQEIAQCLGVLLTYFLGAIVSDEYWRLLLAIGSVSAIVQMASLPLLPESPRWLLLRGRTVEASKVIKALQLSEPELLQAVAKASLVEPLIPEFEKFPEKSAREMPSLENSAREIVSKHRAVASPSVVSDENIWQHAKELEATPKIGPRVVKGPRASPAEQSVLHELWKGRHPLLIACLVGVAQNVLCTNASLYFSTDLMLLAGICKPYFWGMGLGIVKVKI